MAPTQSKYSHFHCHEHWQKSDVLRPEGKKSDCYSQADPLYYQNYERWNRFEQFYQQVWLMTSRNFDIKETVNKNIEKNQFPSFSNHRSMVGWCSMNYPKTLVNPIYLEKETDIPEDRKYDLNYMFQQKNPIQREKVEFVKPLSNPEPKAEEKQKEGYQPPFNPKISSMTLATTKYDVKSKIFEENHKISEDYSAVKPLPSLLGVNNDGKFERKVRQIGQVSYTPVYEGQEMRHLKKLPMTVIDQQNLMTILNPTLEYLDLQYKTDISNDLINKIGYLAPNIKELNLTAVPITNKVLIQLGKSCKKLEAIDISKCKQIEEFAIISFLKDCKKLKKFAANHLSEAMTDACLECLKDNENICHLEINFCYEVTSAGIQFLQGHQFEYLALSSLHNLKSDDYAKVIQSSFNKLMFLDLSFSPIPEVNNALMTKVTLCSKLEELILTGCEKINDQGLNILMNGEKGKPKQPEGFANLRVFKVGGLFNISDQLQNVLKKCPTLTFLEANNLERLSDNFVDQLKGYQGPKKILLNFTPNISDEKIKEVRDANKGITIIRTISKMTDPADDGLRMPIPPASLKIKKPKKKKK